jgi:GntR family carbon starvation induced transcriptional regulator
MPHAEERLTATDRLQRRLEADILTGVLAPGVRIKPATLAPEYGVSVTPFREALARLQSRGLIETDAFVGARVASISREEIEDIYAVRLRLERPALVRAIERAPAGRQDGLRDAFARLRRASRFPAGASVHDSTLRWISAHRDFHWALIAGTDSIWSLRLLATLYDHMDRYQALAWGAEGLREGSLSQHEELFEAYLARDAGAAAEALERHLRSAVGDIVAAVDRLAAA